MCLLVQDHYLPVQFRPQEIKLKEEENVSSTTQSCDRKEDPDF